MMETVTTNRSSAFNSRPHKEVDIVQAGAFEKKALSIHDLTRRSTFFPQSKPYPALPFNSRPHKEVDGQHCTGCADPAALSIHDLTRRSTRVNMSLIDTISLSIHDLTRRSTNVQDYIIQEFKLSIHDLTRRSTIYFTESVSQ